MQSIDFSTHGRDINNVYNKIVSGDSAVAWAVFSPDSSSSYRPAEQGSGGINEFVENFNEGKVEFGLIRVNPPGSDVQKLLLVGWCPDSVSIRARSSFASNFATVAKALHGYHVQVTARDEDDLDPEELLKRVSDAAGARYSIQSGAPKNFGPSSSSAAKSKPIAPKPAATKPFTPRKPLGSTSTSSSSFIPKPIVPKPVAPVPKSPFAPKSIGKFGSSSAAKKEDDGWDGAEEVNERDFTKQPLENAEPAYKPIGKVDVDALRTGSKSKPASVPTPTKAPESIGKLDVNATEIKKPQQLKDDDEDLDEEERAFREKRKLFNNPASAEDNSTTSTPKPKPAFGGASSFKPVAAAPRPGKVPLPHGYQKSKDNVASGVNRNFGAQNGKTPAQIWAEKHGKYDSSASPEPPIKSEEPAKEKEEEEAEPSVSDLASKFKQTSVSEESKPELPSASRPVPSAPGNARSVPPPPAAASIASAPAAAPLPPRESSATSTPAPVVEQKVPEPKPEPEEEKEEEEEEEEEEGDKLAPTPAATAATPSKPELKTVTAIAQFDYEKQDEDEISLKEDELVTDIVFEDEDWWKGKNSKGEYGLFPCNYVELTGDNEAIPEDLKKAGQSAADAAAAAAEGNDVEEDVDENGFPVHTDLVGVAEYDYDAEEDNELSFKEGDTITDIHQAYDDWWLGTFKGERKLIPSNYVSLKE